METGLRCANNLKVGIDAVKSQKSVNYASSLAQKYVVFLFQNLPTNSREMSRMAENRPFLGHDCWCLFAVNNLVPPHL